MKNGAKVAKSATWWGLFWLALAPLFALAPRAAATENNPAMTDEQITRPAIVLTLEKATEGLLMPSETDAPFEIVFLEIPAEPCAETGAETGAEPQKMTPAQIARLAGAPDGAAIETRELDAFFAVPARVEEWMNDEEKATAARFAELLETLKNQLEDPQVVLWGDAKKIVAIIGKWQGSAAGVTTLIVET